MKIIRLTFIIVCSIAIFLILCYLYSIKIEPYRIKASKYDVSGIIEGVEPIKIVQFSDIHIKEDFTYKNFSKIVDEINKQDPDIIIFTGDLYDNYSKYNDDERIIEELSRLEATYDKIAIWGNRDYGGGARREYENIMKSSGFTLLKNENYYATIDSGQSILFTGIDDSLLGNPNMVNDTKIDNVDYSVFLTHEPDTYTQFSEYNYNLILCGHSHGGQVDIPFMPFINKEIISRTDLSEKYSRGMYDVGVNSDSKLYVNTGIGTTHYSARFRVVPEISVFNLYIK